MSRLQAVGVLLVLLGLVYALLYAAWRRKRRRHTSAAVVTQPVRSAATGPVTGPATGGSSGGRVVEAEGVYISTTTAASRHERVGVAGLGNRSRARMVVSRDLPEELVRFRREGEPDVVIPASRLIGLRRERGMAGKFVGARRLLVLQWRADDDAVYRTGFLPRHRADLDRLETALWWHGGGASMREEIAEQPRWRPDQSEPPRPDTREDHTP